MTSNSSNSSVAIAIPADGEWHGIDGNWSTISLDVGTPATQLHVLPGTSVTSCTSAFVIVAQGCSANIALPSCPQDRGGIFHPENSTTFQRLGSPNSYYSLPLVEEEFVGLSGASIVGSDTINLTSLSESGGISMQNQVVAGIAAYEIWLGTLPLSPRNVTITYDEVYPSLLWNLFDQGIIPSISWAYTAGAYYYEPPAYSSLTLGGYDQSRVQGMGLEVPFSTENSNRDLVVQIRTISYNEFGSSPLLTTAIPSFIDSLVPQIWLPLSVCQNFERAFDLTWDNATQLYIIDNATRANLLSRNLGFTFSLGAEESGNVTVDVTLPYAAFDLQISAQIVNHTASNQTSFYFPLKRAANESQSILGRVFLQEAYVVADYGRRNFTISQAAFPQNDVTPSDLVTIRPMTEDEAQSSTAKGSSLSGGAIAGIVIAVVAVLVLGAVAAFFMIRRQKKRKNTNVGTSVANGSAEADGVAVPGVVEVENKSQEVHEVDASFGARPEMETKEGVAGRHEMSGTGIVSELEGSHAFQDDGSHVR